MSAIQTWLRPTVLSLAIGLGSVATAPTLAHATEVGQGPIRRFALVIGANNGGSDRVTLRYAQDDAQAFLDVMTELGGVRAEDAILLSEPDAEDFKRALYTLSKRVRDAPESRTEVIFYYSGHSDERGLLLRGDRVSYPAVREGLDGLSADVRIAVVDSCASGALTRTKGGTLSAPFLSDESRVVTGHAYLTSASADEAAQETDRLLGSFFTHALVTGLRGAADSSGDSRVTLSEAYTFAYDETLERTENTRYGAQHATRQMDLTGTGDLVITDLSAVEAGLVLDASLSGRLRIRDSQGRLIAEVSKTSGRAMELGLGAGRFKISLEHADGALYEGQVSLAKGERIDLDLTALRRVDRVATLARGEGEAPDSKLRKLPFVAGLWPLRTRDASVGASMTALGTHVGELRGLAVTMGVNRVDGDAPGGQIAMGGNYAGGDSGTQISMGGNYAGRDMSGTQVSMGANVARERASGIQMTMGANIAGRDVEGAQISMGANVAGGAVQGLQAAVGGNFANGPLRGAQLAVGVNFAPASSRGVQASSGVNLAGNDFHGAQIGMVNIGRDLTGSQIGLLNIAREVKGSQIGLLNIAKRQDGASLGLLQVVQEGQFHGEVWASDTFPANAGVQFGGRRVFTQVQVGGDPRGVGTLHTSAGLGVRFQRLAERPDPGEEPERDGRLWAEIDLSGGSVWQRDKGFQTDLLVQLRGSVGFELDTHLSPQVGVILHGFEDMDNSGNDDLRSLVFPEGLSDNTRTAVWPSVFVGVQF